MTTITFDTHVFVKRLKEAGFTEEQAEAVSEGLKQTTDTQIAELVTRKDLQIELAPIRAELGVIRAELSFLKWVISGVGFGVILLVIKSFLPA